MGIFWIFFIIAVIMYLLGSGIFFIDKDFIFVYLSSIFFIFAGIFGMQNPIIQTSTITNYTYIIVNNTTQVLSKTLTPHYSNPGYAHFLPVINVLIGIYLIVVAYNSTKVEENE